MSENLYALFESRFPADRAAQFLIDPGGGEGLSFAALEDMVGRFARVLLDAGAAPGARIATQIDNSHANIALYLACLKLGAIYLPLNTAYTPAEVGYFVTDAEPAVFVARPEALEPLAASGALGRAAVLSLGADGTGTLADAAEGAAPIAETHPARADDIAAILYTSGTTGRSKGAMLSHGNLKANVTALYDAWGFRAGDVLLHALPLYHIHGLFVALNLMLWNGGQVILLPKFDAGAVTVLLPSATVFMGVPTFYTRLLAEPGFTKEATRSVRLFVSGSAPLLAETFAAFEERTGLPILERYGMTETGMNCSNPLDGERRPGTVGPPLPGVEARVCDKAGERLAPGEVGVLELRGPNVFKGYWRMPDKTAEEFRADGFFITGDLATISDDGYVTIVGRDKDMIITGGLNVYPKEVEDVINALEGVAESAVIGLPHPDFGEGVAAAVVAEAGAALDAAEIRAACEKTLAKFKVPKRVFVIEALPRNAMGKVQKAELRARFAATFAGGGRI